MSPTAKRTVLITGCSDGGLGAALALAFHTHLSKSYRVFATARNLSKTKSLQSAGIEVLTLDVLESTSIAECVTQVSSLTNGTLDVLLNNAGAGFSMPISDISIPEAKKFFDLNFWSYLEVTQAFLPLVLKSNHPDGGMIVNNTSVASVCPVPFEGMYCASKAATAMISDTIRLELQPFGVKVIDLKTGAVKSNIHDSKIVLPENSIYGIAKNVVERVMRGEQMKGDEQPADEWAEAVVRDLSVKSPRPQIWQGSKSWAMWLVTCLPHGLIDAKIKQIRGLDIVGQELRKL